MIRLVAFLAAFALMLPAAAQAQQSRYNEFYDSLTKLNHSDPLQNPQFTASDKIINRKMVDNKNKVVGQVKDVVLTNNGSVASLYSDLNRLDFGSEVYLDYRSMNIEPVSNTYQIGYKDSELKQMLPDLLANVQTAAGDKSDTLALSSVVGAPVRNPDGTRVGTVDKVLFGSEGSWAEALYISLASGTVGGRTIALPFGLVQFKNSSNGTEVALDKDQNEAVLDYLKKRR